MQIRVEQAWVRQLLSADMMKETTAIQQDLQDHERYISGRDEARGLVQRGIDKTIVPILDSASDRYVDCNKLKSSYTPTE